MNLYADTSWLVSLLYPGDKHHADTRAFFRSHERDLWLTSDWSRFETVNALRNLCLAKPGPEPSVVEAIRRLWKHWHEQGPFDHWKAAHWPDALSECQQLSAAYASGLRMRSAAVGRNSTPAPRRMGGWGVDNRSSPSHETSNERKGG